MKIISCASYYGSGSSAVTDLVSEFDGVKSFGDIEFRFVHDPDGIADLEYNLVENFNRHNSGHAIKRYLRLVDFYSGNIFSRKFSAIFGEKWEIISKQYIDELTDFTYHGWLYDMIDKGKWFHFRKRFLNKILRLTIWRNNRRSLNTMKNEITYCAHPSEEKFLRCTKKYINDLFNSVRGKCDIVIADQILPSSNTERYLRYFDDIKVVIVDRDPRDIFLFEKYIWKDGIIPNDPETFCKWFKYTRENGKHRTINSNQIRFLMFEDLIYKYDETVSELIDWLGLDTYRHIKKGEIFVPEKSINNTRLWEKMDCDLNEINYIAESLKEYLYNI